jgi:secondary thiamine-phosphate synthase enzyme
MRAIEVATTGSEELVDITDAISASVREILPNGDGICLVFCPHTTAGVTLNERADPAVRLDVADAMRHLVPDEGHWRHVEGNSPAHVKATLAGASVMIPIVDGTLRLGRWQGVFLCEFDGPRTRRVWVQVLS